MLLPQTSFMLYIWVMKSADVIVIGGGMVGGAIGYGLARAGARTVMLDEGDDALRTARGNFGLIWVQTKGRGLQRYQDWSMESSEVWQDFADDLEVETGVFTGYDKPGGLTLCISGQEVEAAEKIIEEMQAQAGNGSYDAWMIDRHEIEELVPGVRFGPSVQAASFCPHDGHVNPLKLLRAMLTGFQAAGGQYKPNARVIDIKRNGAGYSVKTQEGRRFKAGKIVIACGHGIPDLASKVGLHCPTRPQRGQILVTERLQRILPLPMGSIRQTDEGSILLGVSHEDVGFDDGNTADVGGAIAARAARILPDLADVNIVRSWGALRIMPPDGCPIYDESDSWPGIFMATNHSGVTLAGVHALHMPAWILQGKTPVGFEDFSVKRFKGTPHAAPQD